MGLKITPNKYIELLGRVRTGSNDSQQSPHITVGDFSGNHHGDADLVFDKWYVKLKSEFGSIWGGRNGLPFWKQNELLWDDDVTVVGGGASVSYPLGPGKLQVNVGYATLPDGMERFNGEILTGQLVYFYSPDDFRITSALGVLAMPGEEGAVNLRNNNGARDYTILTGSLQAGTDFSGIPVTLGVDVYHNIEDYSAKDNNTFTTKHHDEVDGFVISLKAGKLKQRNDWLVGYYYAEIESLAVNASFAQDDWMRWGSASQTDSSDFKGHEFRLGYVPWENINFLGRFYLIDALSSAQDGKRFRLDMNWKF